MTRAYVALGANLGDRQATLESAVESLAGIGNIAAISSIYETDPWGYTDQPPFLNAVVAIETSLPAIDVLDELHRIEERYGRVRTFPNAPRTLDLDVILFGDERHATERLTIPHPRLHERVFVLYPLAEIAPNLVVPGTDATVTELLTWLPDKSGIRPYATFVPE